MYFRRFNTNFSVYNSLLVKRINKLGETQQGLAMRATLLVKNNTPFWFKVVKQRFWPHLLSSINSSEGETGVQLRWVGLSCLVAFRKNVQVNTNTYTERGVLRRRWEKQKSCRLYTGLLMNIQKSLPQITDTFATQVKMCEDLNKLYIVKS